MKHPVTWWQRNCVQGRAEVLLFVILVVLVAGFFVLLATRGWAEEQCWTGHFYADVNPDRDARIAACEKRNFQQAVREAMKPDVQVPPMPICANANEGVRCYDSHRLEILTPCQQKMEEAMRAMERYRDQGYEWAIVADANNETIRSLWFTPAPMPYCCESRQWEPEPPPPTLEEKIEALEQETAQKIRSLKKAAAEAEESRGKRIVDRAYRQWAFERWDAVKRECWRQPRNE